MNKSKSYSHYRCMTESFKFEVDMALHLYQFNVNAIFINEVESIITLIIHRIIDMKMAYQKRFNYTSYVLYVLYIWPINKALDFIFIATTFLPLHQYHTLRHAIKKRVGSSSNIKVRFFLLETTFTLFIVVLFYFDTIDYSVWLPALRILHAKHIHIASNTLWTEHSTLQHKFFTYRIIVVVGGGFFFSSYFPSESETEFNPHTIFVLRVFFPRFFSPKNQRDDCFMNWMDVLNVRVQSTSTSTQNIQSSELRIVAIHTFIPFVNVNREFFFFCFHFCSHKNNKLLLLEVIAV